MGSKGYEFADKKLGVVVRGGISSEKRGDFLLEAEWNSREVVSDIVNCCFWHEVKCNDVYWKDLKIVTMRKASIRKKGREFFMFDALGSHVL